MSAPASKVSSSDAKGNEGGAIAPNYVTVLTGDPGQPPPVTTNSSGLSPIRSAALSGPPPAYNARSVQTTEDAPRVPRSPDPFAATGIATLPTGQPAYVSFHAVTRPEQYEEDDDGLPRLVKRIADPDGHAVFVVDPRNPLSSDQTAWDIVRKFGWRTGVLHTLLLVYAMDAHKRNSPVCIPNFVLRDALGLNDRTDLTVPERIRLVMEEVERLGAVRIAVYSKDERTKSVTGLANPTPLWITDWQFNVQRNIFDEPELTSYDLLVRPGLWADLMLYNQAPRHSYLTRESIKRLSRGVGGTWGMLLAINLYFLSRLNGGTPPDLTIRTLLTNYFGVLNPGELTKQQVSKIRRQLHTALMEQEKRHWRVEFLEWPEGLRPGGAWVGYDQPWRTMLDLKVRFVPFPEYAHLFDGLKDRRRIAAEASKEKKEKRPKMRLIKGGKREDMPTWTPERLRELLRESGKTMTQLADYLECSKTMVSLMANGKREIGKAVAKKLDLLAGSLDQGRYGTC